MSASLLHLLYHPLAPVVLGLILFPLIVILPGRWRVYVLFLVSLSFYTALELRQFWVLLAVTGGTWLFTLIMPRSPTPRRLMWLSAGFNLGVLGLFKLIDTANGGGNGALLPVGISFYTFQALSYSTEVYLRRLEPSRNPAELALYLAFFPKLIAGPLIGPTPFFAAIRAERLAVSRMTAIRAAGLTLSGLFKKIAIADAAAGLVDAAFRGAGMITPYGLPAPLFWAGFYLYAFQIYADFAGYTDLARASALVLGIDLPENFRQPYFARTPADFWNRWHMSLTGWFRQYLYMPVGRVLLRRTGQPGFSQGAANLITMLLIGLWHGVAWPFVLWGLWHGALITAQRLLRINPAGRASRPLDSVIRAGITFHLVGIGWVIFRAASVADVGRFFGGMFSGAGWEWAALYLPAPLVFGALLIGLDALQGGLIPKRWAGRLWPVLMVAGLTLVICLMILDNARGGGGLPFIYARF